MKFLLLKSVENTEANGEIAHYGHCLLLSQCFQRSSAAEAPEGVHIWERVIIIMTHWAIKRIVGQGEINHFVHFLTFP